MKYWRLPRDIDLKWPRDIRKCKVGRTGMSPFDFKLAPLPVLLGLAFNAAYVLGSQAQESRTFSIAATSGYGAEECLGEGGECGRLVADAWCNAHGQGTALKFGRSEDDYGAGSSISWLDQKHYYITCSE
jgi:hypothetical protein